MEQDTLTATEVIYAVEGHDRHFSTEVHSGMTVVEFAKIAAKAGGIEESIEVFLEDAEHPLEGHLVLLEHLSPQFAPIHVARPGLIKVTVAYSNRHVERDFRPNATIARVIEWAIGKHGLNLEGTPADYQLKLGDKVLSPDQHLGQVVHGKKHVTFSLVFKVKPQG